MCVVCKGGQMTTLQLYLGDVSTNCPSEHLTNCIDTLFTLVNIYLYIILYNLYIYYINIYIYNMKI